MSRLQLRPANRTRTSLRNQLLIGAVIGFVATAAIGVFVVMKSGEETLPGESPKTFTKTYETLTLKKLVKTFDGMVVGSDGTHFCKLDSSGQTLWCVSILPPSPVLIQSMVETSDNGIVAICQTTGTTNASKIYVVKILQDGAFAWARTLEKQQSEFAYGACASADNGIILCGSGCNTANYLLKLNQNGDQVWLRDYPVPTATVVAQKVMLMNDGGFVFTGRYQHGTDHSLYIARTDALGAMQYARMYTVPHQPQVKSIKTCPDGGYAIVGQFTSGDTNPFVMKLDGTGSAQWFKTVGGATTESLNDLAVASDNSIMCTGNAYVNENENVNMLLLKFDPAGQLMWHTTTGSELLNGAGYDDGLSIEKLDNGYFMVAGYSNGGFISVTDGGGNGFCHYSTASLTAESLPIQMQTLALSALANDAFIATSLPLGEMAFNPAAPMICYGNLNTGINDVETPPVLPAADSIVGATLTVYPNPTSGPFNMTVGNVTESSQLLITDLSGKVVHQGVIKSGETKFTTDLNDLSNGTYLVYLKSNGAVIGSTRFVMHH